MDSFNKINKNYFFKTLFLSVLILIILAIKMPHQSKALEGSCFYRNNNCSMKYVECFCNCNKYKLDAKGVCPRCRHRHSNLPKIFEAKIENKEKKPRTEN
ncbi:TPA: hypothetical protein DEO28_04235 [Candidatus Dependentiae bacterium]|nr:MAG: hypothetical protein UR14_C0006G0083 [candidate division TM6 bacterium GW2011_GWE2_31_21]KKP53494.1 MAG: hypothetical protein UR43_C0004G0035 [candidate division TM6 bacterium GW2011_GWF2_33_332]HBS48265.1 hypothetical protein [Candidatus Dependentiae bacterium]HBZ73692.1 hypothetical protein [Candidatus Dependentiae bacterium]